MYGDVDKAFAELDVFVERTFTTRKIYHAQMVKSVVCRRSRRPQPNPSITSVLSQIFNIPMSKVNVKRIAVGGTFGSSIQMNWSSRSWPWRSARRPVKLTLTREEDMHDHGRFGPETHIKIVKY